MKKTLSFILSAVILLSSVFCFSTAAFADSYITSVSGTYNYTNAYSVLNIVNNERAKAGLNPLELDEELQDAAMYRAAETVVQFSHTRPNGEICFSVSDKMYGENIAYGYGSAQEVMDAWMDSEGHRDNILTSDYRSIGIGCFVYEGVSYWTQAFGISEAEGNPILSGTYAVDEIIYINEQFHPAQNIRITARGGDGERARIDWDPVPDAYGYLIFDVTKGKVELKGETFDNYFIFDDLTPGWTYEIMVAAYKEDGSFALSDSYMFGAACPTVQNLNATVTDMNTIDVEWDVTTSHGYYLQWSTTPDFSSDVNGTYISGTNSTNYTITTSKPANQYYVRVRAYKLFELGGTIYGAFSEVADLSAQLLPVTGIEITARGGDGERARIDWDKVDGATRYEVYDITKGKNVYKGETTEPYFIFTDLQPGWTYEVKVIAYNDAGESSESEGYMFGAACPTVQNLKAEITGTNTIKAEWGVTTSHGYYLQWSTTPDFSSDVNGTYISGTNSTNYTITTSKPANQYYVRVRAYKLFELGGTIYGAFTQAADFTNSLVPVSGIEITARGGDGERARIDWTPVDNAVKYEVYDITKGKNVLKGETKEPYFVFEDLTPGWTYEVKVVAYNADGENMESEGYMFGAACPTVQNLKAEITGTNTIKAEWSTTISHGYYLQWSTTPDFSSDVYGTYISGTNSTNYTINTSKPADQYYVRVRAYKLFELGGTIYGAFTPAQKAVNVAAQNVQNEVNAYIESKGITVDDSMTPDNSSWGLRIARSQTDLNNGYTLKSCKSEVDFVISDYKNANGFNPTSMYCYYDNSYFYILFW